MKKLFKNNRGFSLAEMLVAMGIVGVITTVVISSLKLSNESVNRGLVVSEASSLKNAIIQNMSNPTACANTFGGLGFIRSGFTLKDKSNAVFAAVSPAAKSTFGGERADRPLLTITGISSALAPGVGNNSLVLTVNYSLNKNMVSNAKQKLTDTIVTNIFIVKDVTGTVVKDCFVDVSAMIISAVKNSCLSTGSNAAVYETEVVSPPYGKCIHTPQVLNSAAVPLPSGICPPGEFLKASTSSAAGVVTYQCQKFTTAPCAAGEYLKGIDTSGNKICSPFYSLFTNGMALFYDGSSYSSIDLNCGTDMVLRKINPKTCVPKVIIKQCPAGQYISDVDANGNVTCSYFSRKTAGACPAGQYLKAINSDGSVPVGGCADLGVPGLACGANYVVRGADASGNPICEKTGP